MPTSISAASFLTLSNATHGSTTLLGGRGGEGGLTRVETNGSIAGSSTGTGAGIGASQQQQTIKPRPSELFAGKGVDWEHVSLTSSSAGLVNNTNKPEDLQSFLKA